MIYYPIETLVGGGITDIMLVTGGNSAGDFLKLLGNGKNFGLSHINYSYQEGEGGIAHALALAEHFADNDKVVVILGDNIIQDNIRPYIDQFKKQKKGARLLLKHVQDPERFGVPTLKGSQIVRITEKPKKPASSYAVIGLYMYDQDVFRYVKKLKPSRRGELEISDVNNLYIEQGALEYDILKGYWTDAGTFESLLRANALAARHAS